MKNHLGKQIIVVDNGFVHVGDCIVEGEMLKVENCQNIRVWGTTKGLGQLVNGPLKSTQHDPCGTVLIPWKRIIFFMQVSGGWS